jgi:hypothetical protein
MESEWASKHVGIELLQVPLPIGFRYGTDH